MFGGAGTTDNCCFSSGNWFVVVDVEGGAVKHDVVIGSESLNGLASREEKCNAADWKVDVKSKRVNTMKEKAIRTVDSSRSVSAQGTILVPIVPSQENY